MNVLAINCGSSSLKYLLYSWDKSEVIAKGMVERIGLDGGNISYVVGDKKHSFNDDFSSHKSALEYVFKVLVDAEIGVLKDLKDIDAIGHRVVHGGEFFSHSTLIDSNVLNKIEALSQLAPLHNPPNLLGIRIAMEYLPDVKQVAIFDTAYHQSIPEHAYMYALPTSVYEQHSIRRYGFHGTSHLYISKRASVLLGKKNEDTNIICLHIGNGASATAISGGKSIDTSMGFTPLEGLVMGTRSGDIDPAIPLYMQTTLGVSINDVNDMLNKESGLLGITGKYTDRRDIIEQASKGDAKCQLAIDVECYRLRKYVGMYMAVLGRVDAIVFTAGVGENAPIIRQKTLEGLEDLGIVLDNDKNNSTYSSAGEQLISKDTSKIKVFMVPTNEEQVFIEDVVAILENGSVKGYEYTFSK